MEINITYLDNMDNNYISYFEDIDEINWIYSKTGIW